jgi:hypothetical protein
MSRSTVPSLALQLVFLAKVHITRNQLGPILKLVVKA